MANITASKSVNTYAPAYPSSYPYELYISVEETGTSTAANTSSLKFEAWIWSHGASFSSNYSNSMSIWWYDDNNYKNGKCIVRNTSISSLAQNSWITITGTAEVSHNNSGKLKGWAGVYWTKSDNNSYTPATAQAETAWFDLSTIKRASVISLDKDSVVCDGRNSVVISLSRPTSSFTDTITYSFGRATGTIATKTTSTSITWVVPTTLLDQIPNDKEGTVELKCQSYNGNTAYGSSTASLRITTTEAFHGPKIVVKLEYDGNGNVAYGNRTLSDITGANKYISGKSKICFELECTAYYGASRARTETTLNGMMSGGTLTPSFEGDFGDGKVVITTRDTRGYVAKKEITLDVVNYFEPTITSAVADRDTTNVQKVIGSLSGKWFNGSLGAEDNALTISVSYNNPDTGPTTVTATSVGNTWSYTGELFTGLAEAQSSNVQFVISDVFSSVTSNIIPIYEYIPVFAMFQNHFDVFGTLHIHDREDPSKFTVIGYDYWNYHAGDVVTFEPLTASFSGFMTSDSGVIVFTIPLVKNVPDGVTTTVIGDIIVRHADGSYIGGQNGDLITNIGVPEITTDNNYVRIKITLPSKSSLTNNSVLCVTPGTTGLTVAFAEAQQGG